MEMVLVQAPAVITVSIPFLKRLNGTDSCH